MCLKHLPRCTELNLNIYLEKILGVSDCDESELDGGNNLCAFKFSKKIGNVTTLKVFESYKVFIQSNLISVPLMVQCVLIINCLLCLVDHKVVRSNKIYAFSHYLVSMHALVPLATCLLASTAVVLLLPSPQVLKRKFFTVVVCI